MISIAFTGVDAAMRHCSDGGQKTFSCVHFAMAVFMLAVVVAFCAATETVAGPHLLAAATSVVASSNSDLVCPSPPPSAMPAEVMDAGRHNETAGQPVTTNALPTTTEDAAAQISGSQWPGVINHLLQRPLPGNPREPHGADIHLDYPSVGTPAVDADIRAWVVSLANAFTAHLDLSRQPLPDAGMNTATDGAENDSETGEDLLPTFELWSSYSISRPSGMAVSITFEIWNYAGASHGNLDILTLNYSLITGQRLAFMDLFEKPETALELMSVWSRQELLPRLGAGVRIHMLEEGTAPLVENFSSLTLTQQGICINFQPYQVAPWAAGIQKVEMPLEALLPAGPLLALWGR